jgi:hypothetical protein
MTLALDQPIGLCSFLHRPPRYVVQSSSKTLAGFWVFNGWIEVASEGVAPDEIAAVVTDALSASAVGMPTPARADYAAINKPLIQALGLRRMSQFQAPPTRLVSVYHRASGMELVPTRNGGTRGPGRGFHGLADRHLWLDGEPTDKQLGEALIEALARCE